MLTIFHHVHVMLIKSAVSCEEDELLKWPFRASKTKGLNILRDNLTFCLSIDYGYKAFKLSE